MNKFVTQFVTLGLTLCLSAISCTSSSPSGNTANAPSGPTNEKPQPSVGASDLIRSNYSDGEVIALCQENIKKTKAHLSALARIPSDQITVENTLLQFENITADFNDAVTPLTFMGYVSQDEKIRAEGVECESAVGQFYVEILTDRALYRALSDAHVHARNPNEQRLLQKTLEGFEQNGLQLSDADLSQLRILKGDLSNLETKFAANLNAEQTVLNLTAQQLAGVPDYFLQGLQTNTQGDFIVSVDESTYPLLMQNAQLTDTRKQIMTAYLQRAANTNTKLLSDAVELRARIAHLMGYKTWADYKIKGRMAKDAATVLDFLNNLKEKLAERNKQDLNKILKFKQETDPASMQLDQWDISYYSYQLKKRDYSIDNEKIREYFPTEVVINGLFEVYSELLGVRYEEVSGAKVWADDVKLYSIHNKSDNALIGYFYTDFYPRIGKYDHAAAFPLIGGRRVDARNERSAYSFPASAIVANLSKPIAGKPALLDFEDVDTIFHEFGHIMHQTLTRAPYVSLSGSAVSQDFVEAPSQMLENWLDNPKILSLVSGHFSDHSQKLPQDMLQKMLSAKDFNQGYGYTKQLLYALFDMALHTQDGPLDVNNIYLNLYRDVMGQEPLQNQSFPASFGHLMGGYDAGYYGYLWSEVYAADMFTQFPSDNLTNAQVGMRYRQTILEQGNMKEASELLRNFLGRDPNSDAFFKKLGL